MSDEMWDAPLDDDTTSPTWMEGDADAESILAAAVMARTDLIDDLAVDGFDPADFTIDRYRWVWFAVEALRTSFNPGTIRWEAVHRQLQAWKADGTMPTTPLPLAELSHLYTYADPSTAPWAADRIAKKAIAARLIAHGHDCISRGRSEAFDADADVAAVQAALDGVVRQSAADETIQVGDVLEGVLIRATTPPTMDDRIPTGFIDLDNLLTGGWAAGQMIVVGARPAMGKTTFGLGLARAAAVRNGIPTLFESLEMGRDELGNSVVSAEARVALHHIKLGIVGDDTSAVQRLAKRTPAIKAAPLFINDNAFLTMPVLRARVRHLVRTAGLRLVIIDYLQLMQAPKAENRQVAVSELSRQLKLLAKEFGITVIVLAQLNRGPEQRTDKKPMVSDLRESGSIEQDADIVILLHREDAYEKESSRAGEADFIVGKHRGGPTATITAAFQGHYARFVDMSMGVG
ncbi:replicative DNA helicase [Streptomyces sp. NPDC091368]|uniref:replicative DNA helicase n=1 Tax=Streptomyces sp. NPDC091368 TaxID=3365993 RepID=UPI0038036306